MRNLLINKGFLAVTILIAMYFSTASAQEPMHKMCPAMENLPGITEEQKTKINELQVAHMKEMTAYQAELQKLEAELNQLEVAENADLNKINAKIDEISAVQNKMDKEGSKHRQAIRNILTPEQRVLFDAKGCKGPQHAGCMKHSENQEHEQGEQHGGNPACKKN
jgi:Spy/CpxP family protein refolding chaperone